jgi:hypothetical protein
VILIDTDRTLSGQDGESYGGITSAESVASFPAGVAVRLFGSDSSIDHVFVMSNTISVRRRGGWDQASTDAVEQVVASFFRHYPD